jgi:nucleotide-binding universal stress UspA family protein
VSEVFSRLLLATERTEFDSGAETVALAMAQRCNKPLTTVFPLVSNPEYEALAPHVAMRAERQAADLIAQLRALGEAIGVSIELRLRRGEEIYREIVQEAVEQRSDVIVIRRRGKRSFLSNLLVGEMVSQVVAHAPCHVLIVPRDAQMWNRSVLVAVKPHAQGEQLISVAAQIAEQCALPLQILSVVASTAERETADEFVTRAALGLRNKGLEVQCQVLVGEPDKAILAQVTESPADLIILGRTDARHGTARVGNTAKKVIGLTPCAVLVGNPDQLLLTE